MVTLYYTEYCRILAKIYVLKKFMQYMTIMEQFVVYTTLRGRCVV